jgi:NCAIR mutase (PurE)-related protein
MSHDEFVFDHDRHKRIGLSEAVLCDGKSSTQVEHVIDLAVSRSEPLLLTRLSSKAFKALQPKSRKVMDFDAVSGTAIVGRRPQNMDQAQIAIVSAGSSDLPVVREASRTLEFHGQQSDIIVDVGVAGLWRILERQDQLRKYPAVIVVAGMDGALFSVVGGLVAGVVIAVPTATGYGTAHAGTTALHSALASCAPGIVAVNVGNGYGAACAALRVLRQSHTSRRALGHGSNTACPDLPELCRRFESLPNASCRPSA